MARRSSRPSSNAAAGRPRAKKSLGQHFLHSEGALREIIGAAEPTEEDVILEIGPGRGVLTKRLLEVARTVIAVEKDAALVAELEQTFAEEIAAGRLELILGDILAFDLERLRAYAHPYKVVANIPYYITGTIIEKCLSAEYQPERLVLLMQKEVAERILARGGKESLLSLSVKVYGSPRIVAIVKKGSFTPPPSVDSAILLIERVSRESFASREEESRFFALIHAGFGHKRKRLAKNLATNGFTDEAERVGEVRAEDLLLASWLDLARA